MAIATGDMPAIAGCQQEWRAMYGEDVGIAIRERTSQ